MEPDITTPEVEEKAYAGYELVREFTDLATKELTTPELVDFLSYLEADVEARQQIAATL